MPSGQISYPDFKVWLKTFGNTEFLKYLPIFIKKVNPCWCINLGLYIKNLILIE